MRGHTIIVDGRDVTAQLETLQFSNSDPGGFEQLQSEQLGSLGVRAGAPIAVITGGDYAWHGRINEKGENDDHRAVANVAGVGYGAAFKGSPFSMVYVDRDLERMLGQISAYRRQVLIGANFRIETSEASPDVNNGSPSIIQKYMRTGDSLPIAECWYDAGQGNTIGEVYFDWDSTNISAQSTDANYNVRCVFGSDDQPTTQYTTVERTSDAILNATATSGAGYFHPFSAATGNKPRFMFLDSYYAGATVDTPALERIVRWRKLAIYGDHRLQRRGGDPGGINASDIATDAARRSGARFRMVVRDDSPYVVAHYVQYAAVDADIYFGDMARLQGYHWGVWEPGMLDDRSTWLYAAPPAEVTCMVSRRDCTGFRSPSVQYDKVYDTARVAYRDPAGSGGFVTVSATHPLLMPGDTRTLTLDMGLGSAESARAFGTFALRLSQQSARGGGSATLPGVIALPGGGFKPSSLLKAGRDRIRITDLLDSGALLQADLRGVDTFLIRRVETTVRPDGREETRVEFDGGADLMEVLNARLAIGSLLAAS